MVYSVLKGWVSISTSNFFRNLSPMAKSLLEIPYTFSRNPKKSQKEIPLNPSIFQEILRNSRKSEMISKIREILRNVGNLKNSQKSLEIPRNLRNQRNPKKYLEILEIFRNHKKIHEIPRNSRNWKKFKANLG